MQQVVRSSVHFISYLLTNLSPLLHLTLPFHTHTHTQFPRNDNALPIALFPFNYPHDGTTTHNHRRTPRNPKPNSTMLSSLLRSLRGSNLEIFKFGMYLSFPIGWMYYFGTNLDERFAVPDYWPTKEQSHSLPYEHKDLKVEVERLQKLGSAKQEARRLERERRRRMEELESESGRPAEVQAEA